MNRGGAERSWVGFEQGAKTAEKACKQSIRRRTQIYLRQLNPPLRSTRHEFKD